MTPFDKVPHMALVHGRVADGANMPTRLHRANIISDVFGGAKSVNAALARFKEAGRGVIVVLRDGTAGVPVQALPQEESAAEAARTREWREVGLGAQILKDLGVHSIRLLTSSQHTYVGLGGFGIEISGTEGLEGLRGTPSQPIDLRDAPGHLGRRFAIGLGLQRQRLLGRWPRQTARQPGLEVRHRRQVHVDRAADDGRDVEIGDREIRPNQIRLLCQRRIEDAEWLRPEPAAPRRAWRRRARLRASGSRAATRY